MDGAGTGLLSALTSLYVNWFRYTECSYLVVPARPRITRLGLCYDNVCDPDVGPLRKLREVPSASGDSYDDYFVDIGEKQGRDRHYVWACSLRGRAWLSVGWRQTRRIVLDSSSSPR